MGVGQLYIVIVKTLLLFSDEIVYHEFGNSIDVTFIDVTLLIGSGNVYIKSVDFVVW